MLDGGDARIERGICIVGRALTTCVPMVNERAVDEPGPVGEAAREAGLESAIALPVLAAGATAVVAWYF